jgi:hypothetical protein
VSLDVFRCIDIHDKRLITSLHNPDLIGMLIYVGSTDHVFFGEYIRDYFKKPDQLMTGFFNFSKTSLAS